MLLWITLLIVMLRATVQNRLRMQRLAKWDVPVLVYWLAMYGFCIAALICLGIATAKPMYFCAGIVAGIGTLMLGIMEAKTD